MKRIFTLLLLALAASSCNREPETLKSPCAGAAGSPCEKIPVNQQMLNQFSFRA